MTTRRMGMFATRFLAAGGWPTFSSPYARIPVIACDHRAKCEFGKTY